MGSNCYWDHQVFGAALGSTIDSKHIPMIFIIFERPHLAVSLRVLNPKGNPLFFIFSGQTSPLFISRVSAQVVSISNLR